MNEQKKSVFILYHGLTSNKWELEPKNLGIYDSQERAQAVIEEEFLDSPGFCDFPDEYIIEEVILDEIEWREGFDHSVNIGNCDIQRQLRRPRAKAPRPYTVTVFRRTADRPPRSDEEE